MELLVIILIALIITLVVYILRLQKNIPVVTHSEAELEKIKNDKLAKFFLKNHIILRLKEYREYSDDLEIKYKNDRILLLEEFKKECEKHSDEERKLIEKYYYKDYLEIADTKLSLFRNSMLVSLYTLLESNMHRICLYAKKRHELVIDITDFRGEGIVRAKEHLEKHKIFDSSTVNDCWSNLNNFNKVRNCLVHCNGDIKTYKNKNQIISIINNSNHLKLKDDSFIVIEKEYIELIISEIRKFLLEIHKQLFEKNI